MARADHEFINKSREALFLRLRAQLKHADDENSADQFLDAECTVEQYLDAVTEGSTSVPNSQDLAFACALLLVATQTLKKEDIEFLARLNAPEIGTSLFAISQQISDIRTRAIAGLNDLAKPNEQESVRPSNALPVDDDVPF